MPLRSFELLPRPGIPSLPNPIWVLLDVLSTGLPVFGKLQLIPVLSSAEAADICIALDESQDAALTPDDVAAIERFTAQGGAGFTSFLEWREPHGGEKKRRAKA